MDRKAEMKRRRTLIKREEETQFDLNDLSVPPGVKINDPVRMYLKEIGRVDLLTGSEEVALAKRIVDGDEEAKKRLAEANLRLSCQYCQTLCWTRYAIPGFNSRR